MYFYQFHIGDYKTHTEGLSHLENLAYRLLIDLYYLNEEAHTGTVERIAKKIGLLDCLEEVKYVLGEFFIEEEKNVFLHKKIDIDIKKYKETKKKNSRAGKASVKARRAKASSEVTPVERPLNECSTDVQQMLNQPLTINHKPLTIKDTDIGATAPSKKQQVPLQEILDAYHEYLPAMPKVLIYTDKRKAKVRTFFNKRSAEAKTKDEVYTVENVISYFKYVHTQCHWMNEERPRQDGSLWRAKNFDYVLKEDCYVAVKELRHNDKRG